jgi:hypothetical protein
VTAPVICNDSENVTRSATALETSYDDTKHSPLTFGSDEVVPAGEYSNDDEAAKPSNAVICVFSVASHLPETLIESPLRSVP